MRPTPPTNALTCWSRPGSPNQTSVVGDAQVCWLNWLMSCASGSLALAAGIIQRQPGGSVEERSGNTPVPPAWWQRYGPDGRNGGIAPTRRADRTAPITRAVIALSAAVMNEPHPSGDRLPPSGLANKSAHTASNCCCTGS